MKFRGLDVKSEMGRIPLSELNGPVVIIHGGAGPADPKSEKASQSHESMKRISKKIQDWLSQGCPELSQSEKLNFAVTSISQLTMNSAFLLENDPMFNAGFGAALQGDGVARVSASYMDSVHQKLSAVMNVEGCLHPSLLAYSLQSAKHSVLDQRGSEAYMEILGIEKSELITPERQSKWLDFQKVGRSGESGTIGVVGFDKEQKHLAVTTSTGGVGNEPPGRIGDTPTVAGNFCSENIAVSSTGYGEQIVDISLASRISFLAEELGLQKAIESTFQLAEKRGYQLACIALAKDNNDLIWTATTTTSFFIWSLITPNEILDFKSGDDE